MNGRREPGGGASDAVARRLRLWQRQGREVYKRAWALEDHNTRCLYLEDAWFGILSGLASAFLAVYVLRLGGSNTLVGLLTALPALITILWLVPAGRVIEGQPDRLRVIIVTSFLFRLAYFLIALVPLFFSAYRAEAVVAIIVIGTVPTAMANVAFSSLFADLVPVHRRARVVSVRKFLFSAVTTAAALLGGWFLERVPFPLNFQVIFALGFIASLVSLYYQAQFRLYDIPAQPVTAARAASSFGQRVRGYVAMFRANRAFVRFTLSAFAYHWGLYLTIPLYSIYWVRNLNASDGWIGAFSMVGGATTALAYPFWGQAATKYGTRPILLAAALGGTLYPVLTALSPSVEPILFVSLVGGVVGAGFNLGLFNRMLELASDEHRPSFLAAYSALINVAVFVAPIIGTSLIDRIGIVSALFLGGALRLLGFLAMTRNA